MAKAIMICKMDICGKRAFTLVELLIASGLSVVIFGVVFGTFYASWKLLGDISEEAYLTAHALYVHRFVQYGDTMPLAVRHEDGHDNYYQGLMYATNIIVRSSDRCDLEACFCYSNSVTGREYNRQGDHRRLSELAQDRFRILVDYDRCDTNLLCLTLFTTPKGFSGDVGSISYDGQTVNGISAPYFALPLKISPFGTVEKK